VAAHEDELHASCSVPHHLAPETHYSGRHQRLGVPAAHRVSSFTAGEIAEIASEGVIWVFSGQVQGRPLFSRSRYVALADGSLALYSSTGARTITYPAGRTLRVLAK